MLDYGSDRRRLFRSMITHFYWAGETLTKAIYLGVRKDAGLFCWNCRRLLTVGGELGLHRTGATVLAQCPECGLDMGWRDRDEPRGVLKICSFTWALDPREARSALEREPRSVILGENAPMTGAEFLRMIDTTCPIQFFETGVHIR